VAFAGIKELADAMNAVKNNAAAYATYAKPVKDRFDAVRKEVGALRREYETAFKGIVD
jgi:hypothetical protein